MRLRIKTATAVAGVFVLFATSCVVPYRTKPTTQSFDRHEIVPELLQSGSPSVIRTELKVKLGKAIVAEGPRMLWARVRYSNSGTFVAFGGIGPGAAGGWVSDERNWRTQNWFVWFDQQGVITKSEIANDEQLQAKLALYLADRTLIVPDFRTPVEITALRRHHFRNKTVKIVLGDDLRIVEDGLQQSYRRAALYAVSHRHTCSYTGTNETLCEELQLRSGQRSEKLVVRIRAVDLLALLAYLTPQ